MSSVVRSILGAALLLTGASAAMAQTANAPVANQARQTGASTATVASNNAPAADQSRQAGVATAATTSNNNAPIVNKTQKPPHSNVSDNNDPYGGHDPNSSAGARAFFAPQY